MVFTPEQEAALTSHLKALDERFFGISAIQCRELAYQYALQNKLEMPQSWRTKGSAGKHELI